MTFPNPFCFMNAIHGMFLDMMPRWPVEDVGVSVALF